MIVGGDWSGFRAAVERQSCIKCSRRRTARHLAMLEQWDGIDFDSGIAYRRSPFAGVAQLVELHVANVVVAGSNPVSCSCPPFLLPHPHRHMTLSDELAPAVSFSTALRCRRSRAVIAFPGMDRTNRGLPAVAIGRRVPGAWLRLQKIKNPRKPGVFSSILSLVQWRC